MFAEETTRYGPEINARFDELSKATYRKVYNMAFRLAGNRTDAEDLTQEAFFRAYRSFRDYEGDRPFENWIFRIVSRLFLDLLRNRRRRVTSVSLDAPLANGVGDDNLMLEMADERPDPEQHLLNRSINEQLQQVLATLSPEQRVLITLADIQNVPYQEIADLVGKPVGTIRSRLHRTRMLIRKRLQALEGQESSLTRLDLGLRPC
ncbi:MAG: sigma-70 family RNA polymerase sigma factor [Fimbriimonadaceae bacterium]|nr:sigma-70 family RNA polymerase sigma factor [Fimbriimonadaceae bacterium]